MSPRIRRATGEDARSIAEAQVDAWRSAYRGILPEAYLAGLLPISKEPIWRAAAAGTSVDLFVVEDVTGIAGFACCGAARDGDVDRTRVGEISAIYLREHLWGRGCGRELFACACEALVERGFQEMIVWVLEENMRARSFYERAGMHLDVDAELHFAVAEARFREVRYRMRLAAPRM